MSEFSNEPMIPESSSEMSLFETWIAVVTKPNEGTFAQITAQPGATAGKAFLWVFLASLLTSFASLVIQAVGVGSQMDMFREFLPPELASEFPTGVSSAFGFGTAICGAPIGALFTMLGFAIGVALIQWVAKLFGGTGSFDKLAYAFSAIIVPVSVVSAVLTFISIIPFVGFLAGLVSFGLSIYVIFLQVMAVKVVNVLETGKAVGAVLIPGAVIFVFVCCCVIGGLTLMGPVIGDVFESINQSLGDF